MHNSRNRLSSYKGDVADLLGNSNFNAISGFEHAGGDLDGFAEAALEDENADDHEISLRKRPTNLMSYEDQAPIHDPSDALSN